MGIGVIGAVAVENTVVVVRSVLKVGETTTKVRDEMVGAPTILG